MTGRELAHGEIVVLVAELDDALRRLYDLERELTALAPSVSDPPDRPLVALLAVDLHSYYTTIENLLERAFTTLEGFSHQGPGTHSETLRRAMLNLPGIRPAILSTSLRDALDELRRFRHFFRHAYALELRFDKLTRVLEPLPELHRGLVGDLQRFGDFLRGLIEASRA